MRTPAPDTPWSSMRSIFWSFNRLVNKRGETFPETMNPIARPPTKTSANVARPARTEVQDGAWQTSLVSSYAGSYLLATSTFLNPQAHLGPRVGPSTAHARTETKSGHPKYLSSAGTSLDHVNDQSVFLMRVFDSKMDTRQLLSPHTRQEPWTNARLNLSNALCADDGLPLWIREGEDRQERCAGDA